MWQHSFNSQDKYSLASDGEHWAGPGVVPSLVLELARSQLKSLLEEAFQVSSASAVVVEDEQESWERNLADEGARP